MFIVSPLFAASVLVTAVIIDYMIGEPKRWHPLIFFGRAVTVIENSLYKDGASSWENRLRGVIAVAVVLLALAGPLIVLEHWFFHSDMPDGVTYPVAHFVITSLGLYFCIAARSLREHARAIEQPLQRGDLPEARKKLSCIVSRDSDHLSGQEVASAACESVLENGSDAIFAALFWFLVAGIPGVLVYRATNTLDAMWGYRSERYRYFGWCAARLDDVLNWLPARLVAFSYALLGNYTVAMRCWREQAGQWKSPNAGPVMSAGAGSLDVCLGGAARYHGNRQHRPVLGAGAPATVADITRALALVDRTLVLWIVLIVALCGFAGVN